jgi:Na+-driven multidrug efflux pump
MGQQFLALATWTSFFFMVEKMGQEELYISHLVRTFYFLSFVIVFGIGQTTKTYVSTLIAEERQAELKQVMRKLIITNIVGISLLVHGFLFYPQLLFSLFTDDPVIIESGAKVLYVVFIAAIIFSFSSVFLNTIEGAGKTSIAFWIELSCIISYIIFSFLMIFKWEQDIVRVWMMDWLYFGLMGILSLFFLIRKPWMYTRI